MDDPFEVLRKRLPPLLSMRRGAALLYYVPLDKTLSVTVDPRRPTRGQAAFETDICIYDEEETEVPLPRVVLELKTSLTTHDVIVYSAKARRHKQVYPYLRYGMYMEDEPSIPTRFFVHNEAMDFCIAAGTCLEPTVIADLLYDITLAQVEASRQLQGLTLGPASTKVFSTHIVLE